MGSDLLRSNMTALLEQYTDDVPKLTEELLDGFYAMAYQLYNSGKYQDAQQFFRFLSLVQPDDIHYLMGLAASYQMLKDYSNAIASYKAASQLDLKNPYAYWHVAECLFLDDKYEAALQALTKAIETAQYSKQNQDLMTQLELIQQAWTKPSRGD